MNDVCFYFNLDGVLIRSISEPVIIPDMKPLIDKLEYIDIFTFSIYTPDDMEMFDLNIRPVIEHFFEKKYVPFIAGMI